MALRIHTKKADAHAAGKAAWAYKKAVENMGIIDFRVRPLVDGYRSMAANGTTDKFLKALGFSAPPSVQKQSVSLLIEEMDAAGIDLAVVPGRQSSSTYISNDALFTLQKRFPERFIIFPLFDPLAKNGYRETTAWLRDSGCGGVSIEPGFGNELRFDDSRYLPLYELMSEQGRPLMVTFSGSITKNLDQTLPARLHSVANAFPQMNIVVGHAGWPWVRELICMAFFSKNLFLAPDLYATRCAGSEDYREAASHMLRGKMLFGSSYPLVPAGDAVACARAWKLDREAEEAYLFATAASILRLQNDRRFA